MGFFMKKIIIMSLLATILIAESLDVNATKTLDANISKDINASQTQVVNTPKSPDVYSALGDVIFNNIENIEKLKEIETFKGFSEKINNYSNAVSKAKEIGYEIESGSKRVNEDVYLNTLRELSKEHDYFIRSVNSAYVASMKTKDFELFSKVVNSGLLDTKKRKDEIIEYYLANSADINASGVIQNFLDEDKKIKAKAKTYDYQKAKRLRDEAKIKRIREDDSKKQAELEQLLSDEVKQKKIEIRENQKKELFD